jgi:hypothetical protein
VPARRPHGESALVSRDRQVQTQPAMRRAVRAIARLWGPNRRRLPDPRQAGALAALGVALATVAVGACKSTPETVVDAPECNDPCCAGNLELVDCSENPSLTCTEPGDPCTAQVYGCDGGMFFMNAPGTLPASCIDAGTAGDDSSLTFGGDDGGDDATGDEGGSGTADGGTADGAPGATVDAEAGADTGAGDASGGDAGDAAPDAP